MKNSKQWYENISYSFDEARNITIATKKFYLRRFIGKYTFKLVGLHL